MPVLFQALALHYSICQSLQRCKNEQGPRLHDSQSSGHFTPGHFGSDIIYMLIRMPHVKQGNYTPCSLQLAQKSKAHLTFKMRKLNGSSRCLCSMVESFLLPKNTLAPLSNQRIFPVFTTLIILNKVLELNSQIRVTQKKLDPILRSQELRSLFPSLFLQFLSTALAQI